MRVSEQAWPAWQKLRLYVFTNTSSSYFIFDQDPSLNLESTIYTSWPVSSGDPLSQLSRSEMTTVSHYTQPFHAGAADPTGVLMLAGMHFSG